MTSERFEDLISKINSLQNICAASKISLNLNFPQIIVVGSQSSGKSSVLESIIGREILPRGTGLITRRPLIIQMNKLEIKNNNIGDNKEKKDFIYNSERVEFNHTNKIYKEDKDIRDEIIKETNKIVEKNNISSEPIILKIFSKNSINLTLIDLPGLIRISTKKQPKDICEKIKELCLGFIKNPNAIILAISASNTDISNSDALGIAKMVDPGYKRTIGVLTKLDLMDKSTDVVEILSGKVIDLKFGFVPVVNRSQCDIDNGMSIIDGIKKEQKFFTDHIAYNKNISFCGTSYLVLKLQKILNEHIIISLPELKTKINDKKESIDVEILKINRSLSPKEEIFNLISKFTREYKSIIQDKEFSELKIDKSDIFAISERAKISYILFYHLSSGLNSIKPLKKYSDEDLRTLIFNISPNTFFTNTTFEYLVNKSMNDLFPYCFQTLDLILEEMNNFLEKTCHIFNNYPKLRLKILYILQKSIKKDYEDTKFLIEKMIEWNKENIFLEFESFPSSSQNIKYKQKKITNFKEVPKEIKIEFKSESEMKSLVTFKAMIENKFEQLKEIYIDQIPKIISRFFIRKSVENIQTILFRDVIDCEETKEISEKIEYYALEKKDLEDKRNILKNLQDELDLLKQFE